MTIRIIESGSHNYREDDYGYEDVGPGAVIVVQRKDINSGHVSNYHSDQWCFRNSCSILWKEVKKPTLIIEMEP